MKKVATSIVILFQTIILVCEFRSLNYGLVGMSSAVLGWLLWLLFAKEEGNAGLNGQTAVVPDSKPIAPPKSSGESAPTDVAEMQQEMSSVYPQEDADENHTGEVQNRRSDGIIAESSSAQLLQVAENLDDDFSKALEVLTGVIGDENYIAAKNLDKRINGKKCSDILASLENANALRNRGFGFWKEKRTQLTLKGSAFFRLEWAGDADEFFDKITKLAVDDIRDYLLKPENRRDEPFRGQDLWRDATEGKYNGILDSCGRHIIPLRFPDSTDQSPANRFNQELEKRLEGLGIGCGIDAPNSQRRPSVYLLLEKDEACCYLQDNFEKDLRAWFAMVPNEELGCYVVRNGYNSNRPQNNLIENERRTAIFAAAFCVMMERTVEIVSEKGEKEAAEYCKQHGWPLYNIREYDGTLLSAKQISEKAGLAPGAKYSPIEVYKSLYRNAVPLFRDLMLGRESA